jgi:acyl dehydratase
MAEESLITDEMRAQIGVEGEPYTLEVDKTSVRMFARAVGYTDPLFYDEEFARARGYRSLVAPPHYLGTPVYSPRPAEGGPGAVMGRGGPRLRHNLRRVLNGGTDIEYFDVIQAGDVLTATSKLADIQERTGSIGRMLIVVNETTFKRDGKVVAIQRGTAINY